MVNVVIGIVEKDDNGNYYLKNINNENIPIYQ